MEMEPRADRWNPTKSAAVLDPENKKDIILTLRDEVENRLQEQVQVAFDDQERRMGSEASTLQEILTNTTNSARESSALNRTDVDLVAKLTSQGNKLRQLKDRVDEMAAEALVRKTATARGGTAGAVASVALVTKSREVVEVPAPTPSMARSLPDPWGTPVAMATSPRLSTTVTSSTSEPNQLTVNLVREPRSRSGEVLKTLSAGKLRGTPKANLMVMMEALTAGQVQKFA
jgi:hypothetical protein